MDVTLDALLTGDSPDAWRSIGFTVVGGDVALGDVRVRCADDGAGTDRWMLRSDASLPADVDGIATWASTEPVPDVASHPNLVTGLDHVVVRSPDVDRTTEALGSIGIEARRTRDVAMGGTDIRQRFFRLGSTILELVGPRRPAGDGPATIWGIAVVVPDIDEAATWLGDRCSRPKPAVQPGRRIATVRTEAAGVGLTVALMTPHVRSPAPDLSS